MGRKLFHILGVFYVSLAIGCLLAGVIVEFHQVHIYKNHVSFWQLQATKTNHKDGKKLILSAKQITSKVSGSKIDGCSTRMTAAIEKFRLSENTIYSRHLFDLITPEYNYDEAQRGPPSV
ncbi:MAG: hypothetical protein K9G76_09135 [Bacteroidales bacterium]|nr:hypothetical protein [Bacteroidales bacterium]MCF8403714.1 hypothetical protein [Bacteroidales bacterium]